MARETEIFDAWIQSQREFMESVMKGQQELLNNITDSARKMQDAFLRPLCSQPGSESDPSQRQAFNAYNTVVETMVNSSKLFTDEVMRMQEAWRHTLDRQVDIGKRMTSSMFEMGRRSAEEAAEKGKEAAG
ncbi:MAG: hypothetical protein ABSG42_09300 [Nitrospirota bacterium]